MDSRETSEVGAQPQYTDPRYVQFVRDMEEAGYDWYDYHGRWYYQGPAVNTDESDGPTLQDVMRATRVRVIRDNMAFDWIVYPG